MSDRTVTAHAALAATPEGGSKCTFQRQPAIIARTAEHYYELRSDGIVTIGAATKGALVRWAHTHGFAPTFADERKRDLRAEVWP